MTAFMFNVLHHITASIAPTGYQRHSGWVSESGPLGWTAAFTLIALSIFDYFFNIMPKRIVNPLTWTAAYGAAIALGMIGVGLNKQTGIFGWIGSALFWLVGVSVVYMFFVVRNGRYGG